MGFDDRRVEQLIRFLGRYSTLINLHLSSVRNMLAHSLEQVMNHIADISKITDSARKKIDAELERAYLNPDQDTENLLASVQNLASQVMEQKGAINPDPHSGTQEHLPKIVGQLETKAGDLKDLDRDLSAKLLEIMGSVSADDVIAQRIDHICNSLHAMQLGLANLLIDFENHLAQGSYTKYEQDLKRYTRLQYTMEEEVEEFNQVFEAEEKPKLAK